MNQINSITLLFLAFFMVSFSYVSNEVELEVQAILDGRMEMLIPKEFKAFSEDEVHEGVPANVVLGNGNQTISLTFNYGTGKANQEIIPAFQEGFVASVKAAHEIVDWKSDEIVDANGHKIGTMEFVAKADGVEFYYFMFFTDVKERILVSTFNCSKDDMEEWAPLAHKMLKSIKML